MTALLPKSALATQTSLLMLVIRCGGTIGSTGALPYIGGSCSSNMPNMRNKRYQRTSTARCYNQHSDVPEEPKYVRLVLDISQEETESKKRFCVFR